MHPREFITTPQSFLFATQSNLYSKQDRRSSLIFSDKSANSLLQFVSSAAKRDELGCIRAGAHRIVYAPMDPFRLTRKVRTVLVRVVANGDDIVKMSADEFIDGL